MPELWLDTSKRVASFASRSRIVSNDGSGGSLPAIAQPASGTRISQRTARALSKLRARTAARLANAGRATGSHPRVLVGQPAVQLAADDRTRDIDKSAVVLRGHHQCDRVAFERACGLAHARMLVVERVIELRVVVKAAVV